MLNRMIRIHSAREKQHQALPLFLYSSLTLLFFIAGPQPTSTSSLTSPLTQFLEMFYFLTVENPNTA